MTLFAWTSTPSFEHRTNILAVSTEPITMIRSATRGANIKIRRRDMEPQAPAPGWVHIPTVELWGTTFVVVRMPHDLPAETPIPLCHRAGSTLWISTSSPCVAGRNVVEAVEPGRWFLVGVHTGSEHIWWDIAEWGGGSAVTLPVNRSELADDDGLIIVSHVGDLLLEKAAFYSRTYGHDDTLAYAEAREFPHEPTSEWKFDPRLLLDDNTVADRFGRHPAAAIHGSIETARPWGVSQRARRSVIIVGPHSTVQANEPAHPDGLHLATAEITGDVQDTTCIVTLKTATGEKTTVDLASLPAVPSESTEMISLMNTPYPTDDAE